MIKIWYLNISILKFLFKYSNKASKQYYTVESILRQHSSERLQSRGEQEAEKVG